LKLKRFGDIANNSTLALISAVNWKFTGQDQTFTIVLHPLMQTRGILRWQIQYDNKAIKITKSNEIQETQLSLTNRMTHLCK